MMFRSFGRQMCVLRRNIASRDVVSKAVVCQVNNNIEVKHNLFHPRLHDGFLFSSPTTQFQSCNFTTFSMQQDKEEYDDLYRSISIEVKGHDKEVLRSYMTFLREACKELEIKFGDIIEPPTHFWRRTLNKAVFASKRAKVQYEVRTYYRVIEVQQLTGATASVFLEYIQRNLPEGCAMKVTKHKLHQLPESLVDAMTEHVQQKLHSEDQKKTGEHLLTTEKSETSESVQKDSK